MSMKFRTRVTACMAGMITLAFHQPHLLAGSVTSDSVWNEDAALRQAENKVPRGRQIVDSRCEELQVRESSRYRCTVIYE